MYQTTANSIWLNCRAVVGWVGKITKTKQFQYYESTQTRWLTHSVTYVNVLHFPVSYPNKVYS